MAIGMLSTPSGHLTNLSTDPGGAPGLAPPDQASFDAHYVGKRVLTDDSAYSLDLVSAGRFQENLGDASYDGNCTYRYAGPDAAEVDLAYDDGDRCTWKVTFEQAASGTADFSCNDGTQGTTNWRVVDIPYAAGAPDMVVDSPSVSDNTPDAGASFSFSATVRNRGNGQSAATTLRYYRSSNSTISSGDTQVGNDAVGGLAASATSDETVTLTAPSSVGTYYYGACVDSVSGESSTSNNCSDGVKVDVSDGGGGGRAGECVEGDTYEPGEGCDVYGTSGSSSNQRFSVLSNGRAKFAFFESGNSIDNRGGSINGVAYHFLASHQGNGVWKVDEYRP